MIPKIIHFIWFSNDPYPKVVSRCIESWKNILPDYEIRICNAQNFNLKMNSWVDEAYQAKKYAFVSDYARFYLLYTYGGIYLDSDVEILRNIDILLNNKAFLGYSARNNVLEAEIIGSEIHNPIIGEVLKYYDGKNFVKKDGSLDDLELPQVLYNAIIKSGLSLSNLEQDFNDIHIYPFGYFLCQHDLEQLDCYPKMAYSMHYGAGFGWRNKNTLFEKLWTIYTIHSLEIMNLFERYHILWVWKLLLKLFRIIFKK